MSDEKKPDKKAKKKKLELNKETLQELKEDELDQVAGGLVRPRQELYSFNTGCTGDGRNNECVTGAGLC